MSVDDRLRAALDRQGRELDPSVESALELVRSRGRTARRRRAAAALAGAAAVVAVGAGLLTGLESTGPERVPPSAEPPGSSLAPDTSPSQGPLRGRITGDVAAPGQLAGRWALQLNGNGTIDVEPPPAFTGPETGALFTSDATTFRTTIFQRGVCSGHGTGIYGWLVVGHRVEFRLISDPCLARVRFFEETVWTASTDPPARG